MNENTNGKQVGSISVKGPDSTGFSAGIATALAATVITEVMGGTPSHDNSEDSFNCALTNKQREGQLIILSDNTTFALILTALLTGMIRGEIYLILFLGRTRIQQMWFIAMKKLLITKRKRMDYIIGGPL